MGIFKGQALTTRLMSMGKRILHFPPNTQQPPMRNQINEPYSFVYIYRFYPRKILYFPRSYTAITQLHLSMKLTAVFGFVRPIETILDPVTEYEPIRGYHLDAVITRDEFWRENLKRYNHNVWINDPPAILFFRPLCIEAILCAAFSVNQWRACVLKYVLWPRIGSPKIH